MWEFVLITGSTGDGCRFRRDGFDEGVGRRGLAAVMADFEDIRFEVGRFVSSAEAALSFAS